MSDAQCQYMVLCGHFDPGDSVPLDGFHAIKDEVADYARYSQNSTVVSVVIIRDRPTRSRGAHLHIDFSRDGWRYSAPAAEQAILSRTAVEAALAPLAPFEITADVKGVFTVDVDRLPEAFRLALDPVQSEGVGMVMESGVYAVTGTPIRSIRWQRTEDDRQFEIVLETQGTGHLGPDFFKKSLATMEAAFSILFPHVE